MSEDKQQVSRRQFLNYTLTGVGGFMAAAMVVPMLRMAVDPDLKAYDSEGFANVKFAVTDITDKPK